MPVLLDRRMMDGTSRSRLGVDLAGRKPSHGRKIANRNVYVLAPERGYNISPGQ